MTANFKTWTICHLSLFMTFIISGLLINCVQAGLYILIGWWHRTLFRKLNYYLVWMIYAQVHLSLSLSRKMSFFCLNSHFSSLNFYKINIFKVSISAKWGGDVRKHRISPWVLKSKTSNFLRCFYTGGCIC